MAGKTGNGEAGVLWTVRQVRPLPGEEPWYALHQHSDNREDVVATGTRNEVDKICSEYSITPEELDTVTDAEYARHVTELTVKIAPPHCDKSAPNQALVGIEQWAVRTFGLRSEAATFALIVVFGMVFATAFFLCMRVFQIVDMLLPASQ